MCGDWRAATAVTRLTAYVQLLVRMLDASVQWEL